MVKMETILSSETLVTICKTSPRNDPKDHSRHIDRHGNRSEIVQPV